jgi:hypothetical protein
MTRIFSPNNIGVLLHYYTRGFTPHPRLDAPAVSEAVGMFLTLGCLRAGGSPGCYEVTARGKAWIEALLWVECPRVAFIDRNGDILGYGEVDN